MEPKRSPESVVREIKRKTRRKFSSEEKIRIVLEGLKGEESISEICRREGINPNLLKGDTVREATSVEVVGLRQENEQLKQLVAELSLKHRVLKKSLNGEG
jgi:transposase